MKSIQPTKRLIEIDALRGVAILLMIAFHLMFDLQAFYDLQLSEKAIMFWRIIGMSAALLFFLLFGISSVFAFKKYHHHFWKYSLKRGLVLLFFALCISLFSIFGNMMAPIYFGVLHFLALSALLVPLFIRFVKFNLLFALICVLVGMLLKIIEIKNILLLPLGEYNLQTATADYYPLFPWFAVVLIGVASGNLLQRHKILPIIKSPFAVIQPLLFLGKHSLVIYLVHQPLLMGLLWITNILASVSQA